MLRLRQDIPLFPGGRKKAFTLSSDDGVTQDTRLTELMRKYGIKGTFHLNSGLMGDRDWLIQPGIDVSHYKLRRDEIKEVYDGFEIAVHTMTHPDLTTVPSSMAAWEISENKRDLEALIGHPISGMSYPFGTYNEFVEYFTPEQSLLLMISVCLRIFSHGIRRVTTVLTIVWNLQRNFWRTTQTKNIFHLPSFMCGDMLTSWTPTRTGRESKTSSPDSEIKKISGMLQT